LLDVVNTPAVLNGVKAKRELFVAGIAKINAQYPIFDEVRGMGLLIGAELKPAFAGKAKDLLNLAVKEGLMILMAGPNVIRFAPSLVITDEDISEGMQRFERAVAAFFAV
jgi:acetylornithine/succinyldiaminopimelate/putrescine aminotransferase